MDGNPVVKMLTHWVAGPLSHPYPSVSNCRTGPTVDGDPGVPVLGLPDCQRASDAFGQSLPAEGLDDALRSTGSADPVQLRRGLVRLRRGERPSEDAGRPARRHPARLLRLRAAG